MAPRIRPAYLIWWLSGLGNCSCISTAQKMKLSADLVLFTGEILNGKLDALCSASSLKFVIMNSQLLIIMRLYCKQYRQTCIIEIIVFTVLSMAPFQENNNPFSRYNSPKFTTPWPCRYSLPILRMGVGLELSQPVQILWKQYVFFILQGISRNNLLNTNNGKLCLCPFHEENDKNVTLILIYFNLFFSCNDIMT